MAEFNFKEMVAKLHFDYVGPTFPQWFKENKNLLVLPDLKNISQKEVTGGKYFMRVKLQHKNEQFLLPNEPLVQLGLTKTIIKTATVGKRRKGTVKEYITTDDWTITIRGVCFDPETPETYPADQVAKIKRLCYDVNDAVEVVNNKFFELFGIRKIAIEDLQLDDMVGQEGMQRFIIKAISDQDFYAELTDNDILQNNYLN